jgi:hypothetical protein
MTSTTPRIVAAILVTLALTAPVASAMPMRDSDDGSRTSSLAGTPAQKQDLRNPDQQAPAPEPKKQDLRNPDQQAPVPLKPYAPVELTKPAPVAVDDGPSPLVYIIPSLAVVAMLGAAVIYTRSSRPARV